jgi:hypothetical protein
MTICVSYFSYLHKFCFPCVYKLRRSSVSHYVAIINGVSILRLCVRTVCCISSVAISRKQPLLPLKLYKALYVLSLGSKGAVRHEEEKSESINSQMCFFTKYSNYLLLIFRSISFWFLFLNLFFS